VFTENLRFDTRGRYLEFSPQMHPKAQTVEQCACAENAIMPGDFAGQIGKRIRRIRYDKQHGIPRRLDYPRNDLAINLGILVQEAQASLRIIAIRGTAGFFVDACRDHDKRCACQI
jgi:hypothetical protein